MENRFGIQRSCWRRTPQGSTKGILAWYELNTKRINPYCMPVPLPKLLGSYRRLSHLGNVVGNCLLPIFQVGAGRLRAPVDSPFLRPVQSYYHTSAHGDTTIIILPVVGVGARGASSSILTVYSIPLHHRFPHAMPPCYVFFFRPLRCISYSLWTLTGRPMGHDISRNVSWMFVP